MLIILTDGFERFDSASQLCSYSGLTPIIRESGSSVKGRPIIRESGNQKLRNLLFMCSFTACKHNKACKAIYDRIVAKGKSKKLALMAVCNKLLKQAFAVAKSGLAYDGNYRSTLIKNLCFLSCFLAQFLVFGGSFYSTVSISTISFPWSPK